jgi:hypothetical protein
LYGSCPAGADEQAAIVSAVSNTTIPVLMYVFIDFISVERSSESLTQHMARTQNSMFSIGHLEILPASSKTTGHVMN